MNNMNRSRIIVGIGFVLTIMAIVFVVIFKTSYSYSSDANYLGEYDSIASDDDGEIEVMESDIANGDEESGEGEEEKESDVSTEGWDLTKVKIETDSEGVKVPVPIGYVASKATNENTVKTGFVIYEGEDEVTDENSWDESIERNQWVWVPVSNPERIYETDSSGRKKAKLYTYSNESRSPYTNSNYEPAVVSYYDKESSFAMYNLTGMTRDRLYQELQSEFDSTIESIKKYGGFYIGRYETGNLSSIPVVQRMKTNLTKQNWYTWYSKMKYLGANDNVKANMIWGCLWDETLQWLVDSENKSYSDISTHDGSKAWGNYKDSTFTYKNTSGSETTKSSNSSIIIPAGSAEYTKANNIYDLAGNVYEWTLEAHGDSGRRCRGGFYNYDTTYASDHYDTDPNNTYNVFLGARAYFYIK